MATSALSNIHVPQKGEEQKNIFRMRVILDRATEVLRDVLCTELSKKCPGNFDPSTGKLDKVLNQPDVQKTLLKLKMRNVLNASQKQLLYPCGNPSSTVTVEDFDVTLTVLLLRNITTLNPNANWNKPPTTDVSREADIGRVKTYRNKHMHSNARLSAADFQSDFNHLKTVLLRLSPKYTSQDYDKICIEQIQVSGAPPACKLMSVSLPRKVSHLYGREDLVTHIKQEIEGSPEILLLTGMGGIGKTSVAIEVGHCLIDEGRADVLFLDMRRIENLDSVQLSLVQHYNPNIFLKEMYDNCQHLFQKALADINSPTVLMFDNIDHLLIAEKQRRFFGLIQDMLKASKHLSVLCTSRESFDLTSQNVIKKHISPLDDDSSIELLKGETSTPPLERESEMLREIAVACGHCPLALKLLNSQIKQKNIARVLKKLEKRGALELANVSAFDGMGVSLEMSYDILTECEKGVFQSLYIHPVTFHVQEVSGMLGMDEDECEYILDSLVSKSVVNELGDCVYDLHPLLKAFSASKASQIPSKKSDTELAYCRYHVKFAESLYKLQKHIFENASVIVPKLQCAANLLLKQLSQNQSVSLDLSSIVNNADETIVHIDIVHSLCVIAYVLMDMFRLQESLNILEKLENMCQHRHGIENNQFVFIYCAFGGVLMQMGKCDEAFKYCKKSLEICEKLFGTRHTLTAEAYNNVGLALKGMHKYDGALGYLEKGLEINEELFGVKRIDTDPFYQNIGHVLCEMGRYGDALDHFKKDLEINEEVHGIKHIDTATSYTNIGIALGRVGKYDEALAYHSKGVEINEELLGMRHPTTAESYDHVGTLLDTVGKYDDALAYHKKSLVIREEMLGKQHDHTARAYRNIGLVLSHLGKNDDALDYCKKAQAIHEKLFGTEHMKTAGSYLTTGSVLAKMGKYDDALAYCEKAVAIREKLLGTEHMKTAGSHLTTGKVLAKMGKYDDALAYCKKALAIHEKLVGIEHMKTADSYLATGIALSNVDNYDDALAYCKKALEIHEKLRGIEHKDTAESYFMMGCTLGGMGNYADCLKYFKKAVDIYEAPDTADLQESAKCNKLIGATFERVKLYREGLPYLVKCLSVQEKLLGLCHQDTIDTCKLIGRLLIKMGQFTQAIYYFQKINWQFQFVLHPVGNLVIRGMQNVDKRLHSLLPLK